MSTEQVSSIPGVDLVGVAKHVSPHPLSPLASAEISNVSKLVQSLYPRNANLQYKSITLQEPEKAHLVPFLNAERNGLKTSTIERRAFVAYYIRNTVRSRLEVFLDVE